MELRYITMYWWLFFTDLEFQESQPWMRPFLRFCALLTPNQWTSSRLGLSVVAVCYMWLTGDAYLRYVSLALWLNVFAGVTDFFDGKSARFRNMSTIFGAQYDATVDKVYIALAASRPVYDLYPLLDEYWQPRFLYIGLVMIASEVGKIGMRYSKHFTEKCYVANIFGKYKFLTQSVAVALVWNMAFYQPQWPIGPMLICFTCLMATVFSALSIVQALYSECKRFTMEIAVIAFAILALPFNINPYFLLALMFVALGCIYQKYKNY